ncbi:MAG TPA: hypothetical protein VFK71_01035 [Gaiellaceae bacterium]|nr:hypothetical protein [Gaiellaceae bacterium]
MSKLIAIAAVVVLAGLAAGAAHGGAPSRVRVPFSLTVPSPEYTAECGFPVEISSEGTLMVTIHTKADGAALEQDVFPGLRITVSAPSTGRSFSHVFGPTTYRYPDGIYEGAPAVITSTGVRGDAPGIPPDAGRIVTPGLVVAVIPDVGAIVVPTGPPVSQTGHFEDPATVVAAICAALAA